MVEICRIPLILIVIALATVPAPGQVRELHPLLPYIFFDSASSVIPDRYILYQSPEEAASFSEANLPPGTLDIYHHLLNIIGSRMQRYPDAHIEIVGCNSMQPEIGEVIEVSKNRGEMVRGYLSEIWGIDTSRLRLLPPRGFPQYRSNTRDPLGIVENRRAEIIADDWRIMQPIITHDTTPYPNLADSALAIYNLILFKFDSPELTQFQMKIVQDYLIADLRQGAEITVTGYTDIVGLDDRSTDYSGKRCHAVVKAIKRVATPGVITSLTGKAVGGIETLHPNELPEGRFYNRCVQVRVTTPAQ